MTSEQIINLIENLTHTMNNRIDILEEKLQGLIEVNDKLVKQNINTTINTTTKSTNIKEIDDDDTIVVENHGNGIKVSGKTYVHRSLFRENGGSWNKTLQAWMFPIVVKDDLLDLLEKNEIEFNQK